MLQNRPEYIISACLCGRPCRYDGRAKAAPRLVELVNAGKAVLVCPECLGGLKTPRPPAEIIGDKVVDLNGKDVSAQFAKGAKRVLGIAKKYGITKAILKERSPSCGSSMIYDGTFSNKLIPGQGVTTRLLRQNEVTIYSEEQLPGEFNHPLFFGANQL